MGGRILHKPREAGVIEEKETRNGVPWKIMRNE